MALAQRQEIMKKIEAERGGRSLVCFFNFDRVSTPGGLGLQTQFHPDTKEPLFTVLKETVPRGGKIDLCLYTRGGDTNAVWPIVCLLREFDPDFEVLVPFRCHSAGTLLALGSNKIIMAPLGELSPIDPSTGNQFNPPDPNEPKNRLGISVEDVQAYRDFVFDQFRLKADNEKDSVVARENLRPFLDRLTDRVHPLALGNVHRVHQQIKNLAKKLFELHQIKGRNLDEIVKSFTTGFFSHLHMIGRHEAIEILGDKQVSFAPDGLVGHLHELLWIYENDFWLRKPFFLAEYLKDEPIKDARFIGGAVESKTKSFIFETKTHVRQQSALPQNVQIQLPIGQPMPIIPGLPRHYNIEISAQGWYLNEKPEGVTL